MPSREKDKHEKASEQVLRFGFAMSTMINSQQTGHIDRMLGQRRERWPNIVSTLGQCLVLDGTGITWECLQTQETEKEEFSIRRELPSLKAGPPSQQKNETFAQCWVNVGSSSLTLANINPTLD